MASQNNPTQTGGRDAAVISNASKSYETGHTRRHHKHYYPTGDIVIQVQKALFKVHRHFLITDSAVFKDMFETSRESKQDGTEETPLLLEHDVAAQWETYFEIYYRRNPTEAVTFTGREWLAMVRLGDKYQMDDLIKAALSGLQTPKLLRSTVIGSTGIECTVTRSPAPSTAGFSSFSGQGPSPPVVRATLEYPLELVLAALVISSEDLYKKGISELSHRAHNLLREEAKELGLDAYYDFVTAKLGAPPSKS